VPEEVAFVVQVRVRLEQAAGELPAEIVKMHIGDLGGGTSRFPRGVASGSTNVPLRISAPNRSRQVIASSFDFGGSKPRAWASFVSE